MRLICCFAALLCCLLVCSSSARAQVITQGPDSVLVNVPDAVAAADTSKEKGFFLDRWDRPAKAAFYSAILPGLGQAYNKSYWKIPILYAGLGTIGYFLIDHNNNYQEFRTALIERSNEDRTDKYINHQIFGTNNPNGRANLKRARDQYRRWRDLNVLLAIGVWGLNIAEAHVHAHLKDFDISDDLSLRVQPGLLNTPIQHGLTPGLTLTLYSR
ncbi:DUF5683 domain-containing protein [Pontibacter sp. 13R65]|uniref:DUF5683 domain-containing protein n=1 Tax=Pontibacter sp. 13R65 TaxID=3127458 RepID=UPI00301D8BE5